VNDIVERLRTRPTGDPYLHMMVHEAADEIERLRAEVAGLREDAERYRWLRSPNTGPATIWELVSDECNPPYMTLKYGANLDSAIDAALAARKGEA